MRSFAVQAGRIGSMGDQTQELLQRVEALLESPAEEPLAEALASARSEDLAEVLELLDDEQRSRLLFTMPPRLAAEVISRLDEADMGEVLEDLPAERLTELVRELPPDDAADLIADLPPERLDEVLERVPDEHSAKIEGLLEYDEESAGGIMTPDLIALTGDTTVGDSVNHVRRASPHDDLNQIYVIDRRMKLIGTVPLRRLVIAPKDTRLADLCVPDPICVHADEDQEQAVRLFRKYDLPAVPVVDADGRLVGRITADDIMDVAEEEAAEDLYRMAGTDPSEMETASSLRAALIRLSWLLPCMAGMTISATVIALSRREFDASSYGALLAFVPMIGAMSGNSGIQISTVIVRGLATGDLAGSRVGLALRREGVISIIMAPVCGLTAALICRLGLPLIESVAQVSGPVPVPAVARAVGIGMTIAILIAGLLGIFLPFLFRRIGVDPAIASGPIVTTANDILSVATYLTLSTLLL